MPIDIIKEAREVGEFAVKQAIWGAADGSMAIRRTSNYAVEYAVVKLGKVAGKTNVMSAAFIAPSGSNVTPAFHDYLRPLLGIDTPQPARLPPAASSNFSPPRCAGVSWRLPPFSKHSVSLLAR